MLTLKPLNLQVRKGGKAERAPSQDSQPLNLIDQFKLSKFANSPDLQNFLELQIIVGPFGFSRCSYRRACDSPSPKTSHDIVSTLHHLAYDSLTTIDPRIEDNQKIATSCGIPICVSQVQQSDLCVPSCPCLLLLPTLSVSLLQSC